MKHNKLIGRQHIQQRKSMEQGSKYIGYETSYINIS